MNYNIQCLCGNPSQFKKLFSGSHKRSLSTQKKKTKFKFSIIQCIDCSLVQTYPRPYENSLETDCYQETNDVNDRVRQVDTFRYYASSILGQVSEFKNKGTFIDIGASIGVLVHEAQKRGFEAFGIEINPYAAAKGRELFGIKILEENIFTLSLQPSIADVIVISHTLEHIESPVPFLKRVKHLLKTDGLLYIAVPNFDGYMVKFKRNQWAGLDPMRHLWQFTPLTLAHILDQAGFKVKKFILNENMDQYVYELSRDNFIVKRIKQYLLSRSLQLNRGDNLICIAEPTSGPNL